MDGDRAVLRLPGWGRVAASDDRVGWVVLDPAGEPVEPIAGFLRELIARDASPATVRSYAFALLRWWRWLHAAGVAWDRASSVEVRELVLWLQQARKPIAAARRASAATAGTINPVTRKPHLGDGYAARTVRHSNAVVRAFYDYWMEMGAGPVLNPVPREREWGSARPHAHHNPLQPFAPRGRLRYNPRLPRQRPRTVPDEQWAALFAALRSDRDRAIVAMAISSGARAGELLGIRGADVDWGEQLVRVRRKGTRAEQWLPVSAESLVWLRLYLDHIGGVGADEPVWQTLRRRPAASQSSPARTVARTRSAAASGVGVAQRVPLTYDALRAALRRANAALGANWSMHDLRHTCALRMVRDGQLSLRDVQVLLGHAHLATTQTYLEDDDHAVITRVRAHLAGGRASDAATHGGSAATPTSGPGGGYRAEDLAVLFLASVASTDGTA